MEKGSTDDHPAVDGPGPSSSPVRRYGVNPFFLTSLLLRAWRFMPSSEAAMPWLLFAIFRASEINSPSTCFSVGNL